MMLATKQCCDAKDKTTGLGDKAVERYAILTDEHGRRHRARRRLSTKTIGSTT